MSQQLAERETTDVALSEKAQGYVRESRSKNTLRAYKAAWRHFKYYAEFGDLPPMFSKREAQKEHGLMCDAIDVKLPVDAGVIANYVSELAASGAKVKSIEAKVTSIGWAHRIHDELDPTVSEKVRSTMDGIRRAVGYNISKKEPATLAEIRAMVATLDKTARGKRDKALLLVGFAGAFRRSELVALKVADVTMNGKLTIQIRKSKTDQEGEGKVKTIPQLTDKSICPVQALRDWLDIGDIASGPVFRPIDQFGNVRNKAITAQSVALLVKSTAQAAGLDWRSFSGHSLRSGFINQALDAGASDSDITEQTHQTVATMRKYRQGSGVGASRAVLAAFGEQSTDG